MRMLSLRAMVLLFLVTLGAVACGSEPRVEADEETRVVERTVTQTVAVTQPATPEETTDTAEERAPAEASPEDVLALQYQHINAGRYQEAYSLFTEQSRQLVSLAEYRAYFESVAPYEIDAYSFPSVQVQGDTATIEAAITASTGPTGTEQYQRTQQMVRSDEDWRVDDAG